MARIDLNSNWSVFFKDPAAATPQAVLMAKSLHDKILIPLLPVAGGYFEMVSGARTLEDIQRLKAQGYHPSDTSDHLFGLFPPTAGASDVIPAVGCETFFAYICAHCDRSKGLITLPNESTVSVGQVIHEKNRTDWIHIANPRRVFFPSAAGLPTLLQSLDNGVTYTRM